MLDTAQRETLAALADVLIPASEPLPSAVDAGVAGSLIDMVLGFRPDLAEPFAKALANCAGLDPEAALDNLAATSPAHFEALALLTAGAYFQSALVKEALAYDGPPQVVRDDIDSYVDLLATVADRGFMIR